jgi:hypothetical protein|tara:strand:+ start:603 stop:830 length:228 start_codon:yes stop_codon:yes gene_type:complete
MEDQPTAPAEHDDSKRFEADIFWLDDDREILFIPGIQHFNLSDGVYFFFVPERGIRHIVSIAAISHIMIVETPES